MKTLATFIILLLGSFSLAASEFVQVGATFEDTQRIARRHFSGDFIVILYADAATQKLGEQLLADPALSSMLAKNFAIYMVDARTEHGKKATSMLNGQGVAARLVVSAERLNNLHVHLPLREGQAERVLALLAAIKAADTYEQYAVAVGP